MPSKRRPILLSVLCLGLLTFSAIHIAGLIASFQLPDLPLPFPDWYLPFRNGFWAVSGLVAAAGLFCGRNWAPPFALWGGLVFVLWYWIDRLLFTRSEFSQRAWPAALSITLLAILCLYLTLRQSSIKEFFLENAS